MPQKEEEKEEEEKEEKVEDSDREFDKKFKLGPFGDLKTQKEELDLDDYEEEFKETIFKNKGETLKQLKELDIENIDSQKKKEKLKNFFISIILLLTLSIHGFFEGVALGLTKSSKSMFNIFTGKKTLNKLIAIIMHKWASALTLGINCVKKEISYKTSLICMIVFAAASPLGVLFGWVLNGFNEFIAACFMCISCGTLDRKTHV